jgi:hypothetical protein
MTIMSFRNPIHSSGFTHKKNQPTSDQVASFPSSELGVRVTMRFPNRKEDWRRSVYAYW